MRWRLLCCGARQQCCNVTLRRVRVTIISMEKQWCYIFWVCVCSLIYPEYKACAECYCMLSSVSCLAAAPYFSTLSHKLLHGRKKLLNTKCILVFCTSSVWNISHCKRNPAIYFHKWTHIGLHVKYRYYRQSFVILEFSLQIFKNTQISNSLYKLAVAEGQSHMTTVIFAFCNFANAHGNETTFCHIQLPKPRRGGTAVHIKHRACGFFPFGFCGLGLYRDCWVLRERTAVLDESIFVWCRAAFFSSSCN